MFLISLYALTGHQSMGE